MILRGRVVDGKHEARFFTLLPEYQAFFRSILGLSPYPGTLNVSLDRTVSLSGRFSPARGREIYRSRVRRINGLYVNAVAVIPGRPYGKLLEVVSTVKLRRLLDIKSGDPLILSVGPRDPQARRGGRSRG